MKQVQAVPTSSRPPSGAHAALLCAVALLLQGSVAQVAPDAFGPLLSGLVRAAGDRVRLRVDALREPATRLSLCATRALPLVLRTYGRNIEAADRAVSAMEGRIDGYREGLDPFLDDLGSARTTLRMALNGLGDVVIDTHDNERLVQASFLAHVFSPDRLAQDLDAVQSAFVDDLSANRSALLVNLRVSMEASPIRMPDLAGAVPDRGMLQRAAAEAEAKAPAVAESFVLGTGAFIATETLARAMVGRIVATTVSEEAAASAGAAAGATVGAEGGTAGGPVGVAAGVVLGFAAGFAVDWWVADEARTNMKAKLNAGIDETKRAVVWGDSEGSGRPGLRAALRAQAALQAAIQAQALCRVLMVGQS